jgi:heme iron utilization protein
MSSTELSEAIGSLLSSQKLAVLATYDDDQPYTSLVAFAASSDLRLIYFATSRSTRKFANLARNHRVSMLIDNRSNQQRDFEEAIAATALGSVTEIQKGEPAYVYLRKHPHLKDFVESPGTAFLQMAVERYYVVSRFKNVMELVVAP